MPRRVGGREPKKRIFVVAEGKKTEPQYLSFLDARARDALIRLVVVDEEATDPLGLVRRARDEKERAARERRRSRDPNAAVDEVWCIFDVDDHARITDACQQARDNGVHLAVSNPSFELWLLLHFKDQRSHQHRDDCLRDLKGFVPDYHKALTSLLLFEGNFELARARAKKLEAKHAGDETIFPHNNPSSGVWRLVESLSAEY